MIYEKYYPAMEHFFHIYFGQDFDLFGDSIQEIVECYKNDAPRQYPELTREIDAYRKEHPNDLAVAFKEKYLCAFSPEPDGYTIVTFLDEVQRLLRE
ncbi:hypothetical protein BTH42_29960 [Burkholderia sp. SRS-W-2-2016]|uniref:contact-dependent growth inhibition system immunity protein n=1 Tax=Burkholderia sp. SRS-W-2-2016 TaxID=1926878 RepID=UPI00094B21C4|nr:contact-dependent growth inhibition system immunity protein [Burkholderia sp. SRS-W-2-2016]OLL28013.1 hypothetical protein BTH42_29960 [Burkholderia sp. SRS-W-2-2016]